MRTAVQETANVEAPLHCFTIWPHRSLGAGGLKHVLGVIAVGLLFVALRSPPQAFWPIVFGCVLTFVAVLAAFLSNMRSARISERVEIGPKLIRVERIDPNGRCRTAEFSTHWVRLVLRDDWEVPNRLTLTESGRSVSIGDFLSPAERKSLADAISSTLAAVRG